MCPCSLHLTQKSSLEFPVSFFFVVSFAPSTLAPPWVCRISCFGILERRNLYCCVIWSCGMKPNCPSPIPTGTIWGKPLLLIIGKPQPTGQVLPAFPSIV